MRTHFVLSIAIAASLSGCAARNPSPPFFGKVDNVCQPKQRCLPNPVTASLVEGQCRVVFRVAHVYIHPGQTASWTISDSDYEFQRFDLKTNAPVRGIDILDASGHSIDPGDEQAPFTAPVNASNTFTWIGTDQTSDEQYLYAINVIFKGSATVDPHKCLVFDPVIVNSD